MGEYSRFLTTSESFDIRRWSADGLAYLTLDADVKEELVDHRAALKALFALGQCQDAHVLYSLVTICVNLTNTYDVQKPDKEMTELATYAKQHIPKEHPKVTMHSGKWNPNRE
jgi:protein unc-45